MATALTHGAVATALAMAAPPSVSRGRLTALLVAVAILPDLDSIGFALGIPYAHPLGHRGLTHSLVFGLALAAALPPAWVGVAGAGSRDAWHVRLLVLAAALSHGLLDAASDGGLGVGFLIPLDSTRYFFAERPLPAPPIDPRLFAGARGLRILAAEALWVWLPLAALCLGVGVTRRLRRRQAGP